MSEACQHLSGRDADRRLRFWLRWLSITSAVFGAMGAAWTVIGSFDPFGLYTGLLAQALNAALGSRWSIHSGSSTRCT